ncbi:MAG: autotransporter-associated beta strand repeat-containing protein [Tepidisphaeraceae bacterium]
MERRDQPGLERRFQLVDEPAERQHVREHGDGALPDPQRNSAYTPTDLAIGDGGTNSGRLDQTAGTLSLSNVSATGTWMFVGRGSATATGAYNLANTAVTGAGITGFGTGSGSLTVGKLWVGGAAFFAGGVGTVNINTTGTITANSTQDYGNTIASVNAGYGTGSTGTINLENGTIQSTGQTWIGAQNGVGTLNMTGGTLNSAKLVIGYNSSNTQNAQGTVNIGAGATANSENDVLMGYAGGSTTQANLNLNGGTLNVGSATKRWLILGQYDTTNSTVTVNSGNLNLNTNTDIQMKIANNGGGTNTFNMNGGAVTSYSDNHTTANGTGVLNLMNSGTASTVNTFNLNGGVLTINGVVKTSANGSGTFNFNGGTLRATNDNANFMTGLTAANIQAGGAKIDSNGKNVTVAQALLGAGGDGGLAKSGAGTLTLTGANSYTGATTVTAGTLGFATQQASIGTLAVADGAALSVKGINSGASTLTATGLTFGNSALTLDLNGLANPTVPLINGSAGTLALNGTLNLTLLGGGGLTTTPNNTSLPLISYSSKTGVGTFNLTNTAAGHTSYSLNQTANTLYLNVTALSNVWKGTVNGNWDVNATANWSAPDSKYLEGDNVIFNDTGTAAAVNLASAVAPTSVTFANSSAKTYTFSGAGITGAGNVTVNGGGTVVLTNANTYAGATTVAAGSTLQLGNGTAGNDGSIAGTSGVANDGTLVYNRNGTANTAAYAISGSGSIVVTGTGSQTLSGNNTFTGGVTVNGGGTVSVGTNAALGFGATPLTLDNGTLTTTAGFANTHAITIGAGGGTINVTTNGQLYLNGIGQLSGSGPLTLIGGNGTLQPNVGNLRIDQPNGYNGAVTVRSGGIFEYGAASAVDGAATFAVGNEGELAAQNAVNFPNAVTVTGGTNSVLSFENGNTGNFTGNITLNANAIVGLRDWYNNATVRGGTISGTVSGNGGITVNSGTGNGGTLTLSGSNTYAGGTTISQSRVVAANNAAFGTGSVTLGGVNSQISLANGVNVPNALTINGGGVTSQGVIYVGDAVNATYGGPINVTATTTAGGSFGAGAGSVLNLAGPITSSVPLTVRIGTVVFSNPNGNSNFAIVQGTGNNGLKTIALGANNALPTGVTVDVGPTGVTGTTFDLAGYNQTLGVLQGTGGTVSNSGGAISTVTTTGTGTLTGVIQDGNAPVAVTINGNGTNVQTFSGANTYSGVTTITSGTLHTTTPSYTHLLSNAGGVDLAGAKGKFTLDYTGGTTPVAQVKSLLDSEFANGGFATGQIHSSALSGNRTIGYGDNETDTVTLRLTLGGDADLDGDVDFNDFLVLQSKFGQTGTRFDQANFNYDGATDFNDFLTLQANFGQSITGADVAVTAAQVAAMTAFAADPGNQAVPEPTSLALLGLGATGLLRRRRRA